MSLAVSLIGVDMLSFMFAVAGAGFLAVAWLGSTIATSISIPYMVGGMVGAAACGVISLCLLE